MSKRQKKLQGSLIWLPILCIGLGCVAVFSCLLNIWLKHSSDREREQWVQQEARYQERIGELEQNVEDLEQELNQQQNAENLTSAGAYLSDLTEQSPGDILEEEKLDRENIGNYFTAVSIKEGDEIYQRINGKSYRENDNISLDELVYLKMLHYNFQGEIQVGEMIVHRELAEDVLEIFQELFENQYEIQSMYLVDNYWAGNGEDSDFASIEANNTSAFNYREVTGGTSLSNHAYGRAIDINPQQNPYVWFDRSGTAQWSHENADAYINRESDLAHVIDHENLCYQLFAEHGFSWGGDWDNPKDYQHFEKSLQ